VETTGDPTSQLNAQGFGRSPRLSAQVLVVLLTEVVTQWPPGSLLPRESDLAERYGISRGVMREVLRGLEERGIVTVRHGHGAIVNEPEQWDILDVTVLNAVLDGDDGIHVLREVLECRRLLEVYVAKVAAARAKPEEVAAIRAALDEMAAAAELPAEEDDPYLQADRRFHEALARAAGNRAITRITDPLQRAFFAAHRPLVHPEARRGRSVPEHEAVVRAIESGDPEAASAAMERLLSTVEGYVEDLERQRSND
jgi:GntR family transcriptional repressor for pyruvate dehydrogenase complex